MSEPKPKHWTDVKGWLSEREGQKLQDLAEGGLVLELGSYHGRSTCALAEVAARVVSVDHHRGDRDTGLADSLFPFIANLNALGVEPKVEVLIREIETVGDELPDQGFDLVFIDGQHDAESVERDTRLAARCVKPGGVIAWHDWHEQSVRLGACAAGRWATETTQTLGWTRA